MHLFVSELPVCFVYISNWICHEAHFFSTWITGSLHALHHREVECNERRRENREREKQNKNHTTLHWTSRLNVRIRLQTVPVYPEFVFENRSGEPHTSRASVCITSETILYNATFLEYDETSSNFWNKQKYNSSKLNNTKQKWYWIWRIEVQAIKQGSSTQIQIHNNQTKIEEIENS